MLSSGANVIIWVEMLSSGMKCYHLELMISSGTKCYHLGWNVFIWDEMFFFLYIFWRARVCRPLLCLCRPFMIFEGCLDSNPEYCRSKLARYRLSHLSLNEMLSSGANAIIWTEMLSSGIKCYHLELMLSSGSNVIIWDEMLSSGMKCYHLGWNVIIWD